MSIDIYSNPLTPFANQFNTASHQGTCPENLVSGLIDPNDILECAPRAQNRSGQNAGGPYGMENIVQLIMSLINCMRPGASGRNDEHAPPHGNRGGGSHEGSHGGGKYGYGGHGGHGNHGGVNPAQGNSGGKGGGTTGNIGRPVGGGTEFQASLKDSMTKVGNIGGRGDVVRIGFNEGRLTANSTSPRAEVKHGANLKEGSTYNVKFGYMREKNTDTTLWQVLDHNGSKPKPRAWISTRNGEYILNLRENGDKNGGVKKYNLGPASAGKWDDFDIDFKRGKGNGSINVKINGKSVFHKEGISTMFDNNSTNAYFKYGQYRNQGDRSPAAVYYSGFTVSEI